MRWKNILIVIFGVVFVTRFYCTRQPGVPNESHVQYGGTFQKIMASAVETIDPQAIIYLPDWQVASMIYEGLVGYDHSTAEIVPCLAEAWEVHDQGRRWLFTLRDDIRFQNDPCFPQGRGRPLKTSDVLYTFERIATQETHCSNWYLLSGKIVGIDAFYQQKTDSISGIIIHDDRRIEFKLTKSYATFLKILASPTTYIVPKEAVTFYGGHFFQHPVGTGPFRLIRWKPFQEITLIKNPHYWRRDGYGRSLPYLDGIHLRQEANQERAFAEFLKGDNYLVEANETFYGTLMDGNLDKEAYRIVKVVPAMTIRFLGITVNSDSPLARYKELRSGLAMGFDRAALRQAVQPNKFYVSNSLIPPFFLNGHHLEWYPYAPDEAARIFEKYESELNAWTGVLLSNIDSKDVQYFHEALIRYTDRVQLNIQSYQYFNSIVHDRPDIFRVAFLPSFPDPEEYYALFYSKSAPEINLTGYRNQEYDDIFETAMIEQNSSRRMNLFIQLEAILKRDVPLIYLNHGNPTMYFVPRFVHGLKIRFVIPDYSEVWIETLNESTE